MRSKSSAPFFAAVVTVLFVPASAVDLTIDTAPDGAHELAVPAAPADTSQRLELAEGGFSGWFPFAARQGGGDWLQTVPSGETGSSRFFRAVEERLPAVASAPAWRRSITLADEPFFSDPAPGGGGDSVRWVKFVLRLDDLPEVYFQDTTKYPFHYDFASRFLGDPFAGMDREAFNRRSLFHAGREIVLGTVLFAPRANEYAIQFVGEDIFPKEMVRFLYESVDAKISKPPGSSGFYLPATTQAGAAAGYAPYLRDYGVTVAAADRWLSGDGCYSPGWALGRLVYVPTEGIADTYIAGTLRPDDILLTDAVPAEIPSVAGVLSLQPATPNSHVAILARSYGIPFAYLSEPSRQVAVQALSGRRVYLDVGLSGWGGSCLIRVVDAGSVDPALAAGIKALNYPPELNFSPVRPAGSLSVVSLDAVTPSDISTIGGKAANFGFLRRAIPDNSPVARAFTFDLWAAYLDQPLPLRGGRTLREEIEVRLDGTEWPPKDMAALDASLDEIRSIFKDEADFNPDQRTAILAMLSAQPAFDPTEKIRFRSSTNVEDSASFVGAGLYDSYSGCIMDDTDPDDAGPSHCDPDQPEERGVFRALRKVYASFYNLNAYLERLRRGVDENQVGMAVVVHRSFPDGIEAGNGVATALLQPGDPLRFMSGEFVSQLGAESVTNPTGGSLPEIVTFEYYQPRTGDPDLSLVRAQRSSRLPDEGETVMAWKDDYTAFTELFFRASSAFKNRPGEGLPNRLTLEFETKKLTDGSLVVKQLRLVPDPSAAAGSDHSFLLDEPTPWRVFQGEVSDVFANHRLKSLFRINTESRALDTAGIEDSIFCESRAEIVAKPGMLSALTGFPSSWPSAAWSQENEFGRKYLAQSWQSTLGGVPASLTLDVTLPNEFERRTRPVVTLRDLTVRLHAAYSTPQLTLDYEGKPTMVEEEIIELEPGTPGGSILRTADRLVTRTAAAGGVSIETGYYWPTDPLFAAGYTAPLERWDKTTIAGLTAQPMVLTGYYSQSYRPEHHNFGANFIFEPGLDPGVSASQRSALEAANIKLIYLRVGGRIPDIRLIGRDGAITKL